MSSKSSNGTEYRLERRAFGQKEWAQYTVNWCDSGKGPQSRFTRAEAAEYLAWRPFAEGYAWRLRAMYR